MLKSNTIELEKPETKMDSKHREYHIVRAIHDGDIEELKRQRELKEKVHCYTVFEQAFCQACECGDLELAKWLLGLNPKINISILDEDAFYNACSRGHLELAKWLLVVKPDIDISVKHHYIFRDLCKYRCTSLQNEVIKWLQSFYPDKYYIEIVNNEIEYCQVIDSETEALRQKIKEDYAIVISNKVKK